MSIAISWGKTSALRLALEKLMKGNAVRVAGVLKHMKVFLMEETDEETRELDAWNKVG